MISEHYLSKRDNWQREARITGDMGEKHVFTFLKHGLPKHYKVVLKPKKIPIYSDGKGIVLDLKVTNTKTQQCIFIEVKTGRQGGNATEERASKFLSKGIKRKIKELYNTPPEPILTLFAGRIFEGEEKFICEWTNKEGKLCKKTINPNLYREKVDLLFEDQNYGFVTSCAVNNNKILNKVREIV